MFLKSLFCCINKLIIIIIIIIIILGGVRVVMIMIIIRHIGLCIFVPQRHFDGVLLLSLTNNNNNGSKMKTSCVKLFDFHV